MKKILFIIFLFITITGFSQEKSIQKLTAFPNPFSFSTKITFNTTTESLVTFTVRNVLGKTVHTQKIKAIKGKNSLPFFKGNLSTGIYIYTLQNKNLISSKRFVIQ